MGRMARQIERQQKKKNGTLVYKKAVAKKMGVSLNELNAIIKKKEKNKEEY